MRSADPRHESGEEGGACSNVNSQLDPNRQGTHNVLPISISLLRSCRLGFLVDNKIGALLQGGLGYRKGNISDRGCGW